MIMIIVVIIKLPVVHSKCIKQPFVTFRNFSDKHGLLTLVYSPLYTVPECNKSSTGLFTFYFP